MRLRHGEVRVPDGPKFRRIIAGVNNPTDVFAGKDVAAFVFHKKKRQPNTNIPFLVCPYADVDFFHAEARYDAVIAMALPLAKSAAVSAATVTLLPTSYSLIIETLLSTCPTIL